MVADSEIQRIARLTPLADVLASFDLSIGAVMPRDEMVGNAVGLTLATTVTVDAAHPNAAVALRDGYAVRADATLDASSYAPVPLKPPPPRIELGNAMPSGADAILPLDAVEIRHDETLALHAATPGDGVLAAAADASPGLQLRLSGARLRHIDVALFEMLGIDRVAVRQPRVKIVCARKDAILHGAARLIGLAIDSESGVAVRDDTGLEAALNDERADAVVAIGGTGGGRNDTSVRTLARCGRVEFHGIGITPGETTALGFVGKRPVLLLPGRFDAALAGWLTVGRRMLARLAFRLIEDQPFSAELARKIASPLGFAEVIPVRRRLGKVEPCGSGYLSMQALVRAEGWILVPADSEGYPAGARVVVRPWP